MTKRLRRRRDLAGESTATLRREAFPTLTAFVRGCLHEDFPAITDPCVLLLPSAATPARTSAACWHRSWLLLRATSAQPARELQRFVAAELGSRWEPGSRQDLVALLELFRTTLD
jgi:hypothetical protein